MIKKKNEKELKFEYYLDLSGVLVRYFCHI